MIRQALVAGLLAGLAACNTGDPSATARATAPTGAVFVPDAGGLGVAGSAQRIDFGRAPSGVISVMDRERGEHRELSLAGCPPGVVKQLAWGDLVLSFGRERFVGWQSAAASAGTTCSTLT